MSKIIGATVGTTISPKRIEDKIKPVKTVNNQEPDENGNVEVIGNNGKDGVDGVSPTVTTSKSGKVTTIKITDKSGTKTATINDGADGTNGTNGTNGKDGTSVTVSNVSESTASGGTNTVTFSDGKKINIKNGVNGTNGTNGKTPVKGTDYFTAADKAEMVNSVKSDFAENGLTVGAEVDEATKIKKNYVAFTSSTGEGAYMTSEENDTLTFYGTEGDLPVQLKNLKAPSDTRDAATKEYVDGKVGALSIPTKVSDLRNDSGYIIEDDVGNYILDASEEWTFTLANGSTVTKKVVLG